MPTEEPFKASTFISTDGCAAGWLPDRLEGREVVTYLRESLEACPGRGEESWGQGAPDFTVRAPGKAGELVTRTECVPPSRTVGQECSQLQGGWPLGHLQFTSVEVPGSRALA